MLGADAVAAEVRSMTASALSMNVGGCASTT